MFVRFLNNNNEFIIDGIVDSDIEKGISGSNIPYAEFDIISDNSHVKYEGGVPKIVNNEPVYHVVRVFGDLINYADKLTMGCPVRVHGHFRNMYKDDGKGEELSKTVVSWHKIISGGMLERISGNEDSFSLSLDSLNNNPAVANFLRNRKALRESEDS